MRLSNSIRISVVPGLLALLFATQGAWAQSPAEPFFTLTPCRIFDSRIGDPPPLTSGVPRVITLAGVCGIPASATDVTLNITAVSPTSTGSLAAYASDTATPATSVLNFNAHKTRANNAVVHLSADGKITILPTMVGAGSLDLILDTGGYFSPSNPPVLTAGATLSYTENDPPTAIDPTVTVTDIDDTNLISAKVQLTGNYQNGEDVLSFVNTPNITGVFTAATGTLDLTGSDTLANWQTALRSVRYNNTSENPSTAQRTVTWTATDATSATSAGVTSTIDVAATNDPPVLTAGGTLNYPENAPPTAIDTTITVSDPDSANLQSATAQITSNYQNGEDVLSFVDTPNITGLFSAATGTLTLTGSDTLANWQTALRSVRYENTSMNPSTASRTVTWIGSDGSAASAPVTSTISLATDNDAPVLTAGGTLNYTENAAPTAIDTTITVNDIDSANLQSATAQITGNYQNGEDVLSFVNTPNITAVFTAASGTLTLTGSDTLANWQAALRAVRYNNTSENPATAARTVTWIASDGSASSAPVTSTINVTRTNDGPTLTAGGTLNYTENAAPTAIDTTITVNDPDSANLQSATAQITANYQNGEDVLSFVNTPNITGVFTAASGTLTLTGSDTLANWQTALRSVRYNNTSENPATAARTVTWIASDGSAASAPVTSTISLATDNDAPVLTAGGTLNYTENAAPTAIDTTITVNDIDSANLQSATAQITGNYQNGEDVLSFVNTPNITAVFTAASGTLTLTGSDTLANWQAALRAVRYNNTSENPATAARTVTWIASDGSTASAPVTSTINVTRTNDGPTLTAGGTLNYTENNPPTAIDTTITVNDVDSANLQSATVQITGNYQNGQDVLSFVNTPNITGVFTAASGTLTLTGSDTLANWQTALRSVRYNNTSENPVTAARTVTWIASDGSASSSPVTSTINLTATNDAPALTAGGTLNYTENDPPTAIDTTVTVNDIDSANLQSATVQITGNYQNGQDVLSFINTPNITGVFTAASGTLTLTGSDTLANWQTALRSVRYNNTSENPATAARTVTWIASDGSAPSTPVTSTINVTRTNDGPTLTAGGTLNYTENNPATAIDTTITVNDIDSANLQSATVQITGNYQNGQDVLSFINTPNIIGVFTAASGTLTLTGSDTLANWQTALRSVRYNNTSENPSTAARTVTWIASDGSASSSPVTSTINVTAVNDPPSLTAGGTLNYTENDPPTAIDTTITVNDVDSANLQSATVQISNNYVNGQDVLSFVNTPNIIGVFTAASGTLTLTGSDTLANWQTALRSVRYHNTSDNPSSAVRTVTWIASDGSATSLPVTSTINVIPVNDAPMVIPTPKESFQTIGNTAFQYAASKTVNPAVFLAGNLLTNFTDIDGPGSLSASLGTATLGAQVTVNSDGTFTYIPPAGATVSDTFTYIVTDGITPAPARTITINFVQRVWYVKNDQPAGGLGRSNDPFDTLVEAQTASAANDYIFVYFGDGTTAGQNAGILLKGGQHLIGQHTGLSIPVDLNSSGSPTNLVPAVPGNRPLLDDTVAGVPEGVAATDAVPTEIVGLNLAGNVNGIDWTTTAAFAGTGTLTIRDNVIRSATAEGVDINLAGTNAVNLSFHDNNLTATGSGLDIQETGTGSLTITGFADNVVNGNTGGSGIIISTAVFDAVPGGALNTVDGGTTTIGASGNGVGGAGMVLASVQGDLHFSTNLNIFADGGAGLSVSGTGAGMQVRVASPSAPTAVGVIEAIGGPAVDATAVGLDLRLTSLKSTNSASTGVSLTSVTGTMSAESVSSITNPTGTDFAISGGTANVTYKGTITDDVGQLVSVASATAGTKSFTGAITDGDDGDGSGISLTGNTGATISFSGGVVLNTGSSPAFTATGGGTVAVCDENPCNPAATGLLVNKLTTTTGTALNVANTTISSNKLEFRSISAGTAASGPASGIVLNNTGASGGLTVSGTGSAGSGGTIQKATADGISLTSTSSVSLSFMNVTTGAEDGIDGTSVNGFSLASSSVTNNGNVANEEGISFSNLSGAVSMTNVTATGNAYNNLRIDNTAGTISSLTILGSSFSNNLAGVGNHGALIEIRGTSQLTTASITNTTISGNEVIGIQVTSNDTAVVSDFTISGCTITNNELGIDFSKSQTSSMQFKILNNTTFTGQNSHGINLFTAVGAGTTGNFQGRIQGNTIGNAGVAGSGSAIGNCIRVNINGDANADILVDGNTLRQCPNGRGIEVIGRNGTGGLDVTVTNNNVNPNDTSGFPLAGIFVQSNCATVCNTVRADVRGNTVPAGSAIGELLPTFIALVETGASTLQLVDTAPASPDCTSQLTSTNTGSASASAGCALIAGPINTPP